MLGAQAVRGLAIYSVSQGPLHRGCDFLKTLVLCVLSSFVFSFWFFGLNLILVPPPQREWAPRVLSTAACSSSVAPSPGGLPHSHHRPGSCFSPARALSACSLSLLATLQAQFWSLELSLPNSGERVELQPKVLSGGWVGARRPESLVLASLHRSSCPLQSQPGGPHGPGSTCSSQGRLHLPLELDKGWERHSGGSANRSRDCCLPTLGPFPLFPDDASFPA